MDGTSSKKRVGRERKKNWVFLGREEITIETYQESTDFKTSNA